MLRGPECPAAVTPLRARRGGRQRCARNCGRTKAMSTPATSRCQALTWIVSCRSLSCGAMPTSYCQCAASAAEIAQRVCVETRRPSGGTRLRSPTITAPAVSHARGKIARAKPASTPLITPCRRSPSIEIGSLARVASAPLVSSRIAMGTAEKSRASGANEPKASVDGVAGSRTSTASLSASADTAHAGAPSGADNTANVAEADATPVAAITQIAALASTLRGLVCIRRSSPWISVRLPKAV